MEGEFFIIVMAATMTKLALCFVQQVSNPVLDCLKKLLTMMMQ
jgi:hypothetical protein